MRHYIQTVMTVNTAASLRNRRSLCRSRLTSTVPFTSPPSVSPALKLATLSGHVTGFCR